MTYDLILDELHEYCRLKGWKPSTVCVRALNDGRYPDRHKRRIEALERDAQKLRQFMADNPPPAERGAV
jgi:hypothetical protein